MNKKPSSLTAQRTRRRTLFPLSAKKLCFYRSTVAISLHWYGFSVYEIRQIMNTTPDKVRQYLAYAKKTPPPPYFLSN